MIRMKLIEAFHQIVMILQCHKAVDWHFGYNNIIDQYNKFKHCSPSLEETCKIVSCSCCHFSFGGYNKRMCFISCSGSYAIMGGYPPTSVFGVDILVNSSKFCFW